MTKKTSKWLLVSVLTALLTTLIAFGTGPTNVTAAAGRTLVYGSTADPKGLSPLSTADTVSSNVIQQIYETLFRQDAKTLKAKPWLAKSYERKSATDWIIHLRTGIKFQDGTPFNAAAVKYTFDQMKDPKRAAPRASLLEPIASTTVVNDRTVEIKTKYPYGPFLAMLSHPNASIVSPTADKKGKLNTHPVGTGPFKFKSWTTGDSVKLVRNTDYWGKKPKLAGVTFKTVPDYATAVSMLQTGKIQLLDNVTSDYLSRIKSLTNVKLTNKVGTPMRYFGFNMQSNPGKNKKFRQAAAYAINAKTYVAQLNGLGTYNPSLIGPELFGYNKNDKKAATTYNLRKAKELVKANGFNKKTYTILVGNQPAYVQMAQVVQQQLAKAGIKVKIEKQEWATYLTTLASGKFEMTFSGWANSTGDASELFYPNLDSKNIGSSNYMRYSNKQFDAEVEKSRETLNTSERKKALSAANKIAMKDLPWIVMDHNSVAVAQAKDLKGVTVLPTGMWYLGGAYFN